MQKDLLKKYALIEEKAKAIEEEKQMLRAEILADMQKNKLDKIESDFGKFTVSSRRTWTYSATIIKLAEKLKIAKVKEETKGIAKAEVTEYLLFKPVKE